MNIVIFSINLLCCPSSPINYCKWKEPGETCSWNDAVAVSSSLHSVKYSGRLFFHWNAFFFFFFWCWLSWEQTRSLFFLFGCFFFFINFVVVVVVYEIQRVVWGKHVAPVFLFVWCTGVLQKAWHGCCRPAFLCGSKRTKLPTGVVLTRLSARSLVINMCSDLRN